MGFFESFDHFAIISCFEIFRFYIESKWSTISSLFHPDEETLERHISLSREHPVSFFGLI